MRVVSIVAVLVYFSIVGTGTLSFIGWEVVPTTTPGQYTLLAFTGIDLIVPFVQVGVYLPPYTALNTRVGVLFPAFVSFPPTFVMRAGPFWVWTLQGVVWKKIQGFGMDMLWLREVAINSETWRLPALGITFYYYFPGFWPTFGWPPWCGLAVRAYF